MNRIRFLELLFLLGCLIIAWKLFYWQVISSQHLKKQADQQQKSWVDLPAHRGDILASDNFPLASSVENYLLYINPQQISSPDFLDLLPSSASAKQRFSKAKNSSLFWYVIAHQVPFAVKQKIEDLKISGLGFEPEPGRVYPEGSSSAYLLGFVAQDESGLPTGYFGLEGFYDRLLSGRSGRLLQEHDAFGRPIVFGQDIRLAPQPGRNLTTSIDRTVQFILQNALTDGLTRYHADGGSILVMNPFSGQILGLVSYPSYDPAKIENYSQSDFSNPVVSQGYEPGSTFKVIVMASALDSGAITPNSVCPCTGPVTIADAVIKSFNDKYYPQSSMPDVILHSDNVGLVWVNRQLGKSKFLSYLRRFGFGQPTGVDLQEESSPPLRPDNQWYEIDWATASFGQGIAVTRLQLLRAVAAIANGGRLVTPRVATGQKTPPPSQIISAVSAAQTTQMMVNGVNRGEVRYYKPEGYSIAGKSGTAQVPISGHYDPSKVISSFIGFAPADKPKFVMLVTLDNPKPSQWGSTTAAPLWFATAKKIFTYYGI